MLRDSTLESLTPSVDAPSVSSGVSCIFFPTSSEEGMPGIPFFNSQSEETKKIVKKMSEW
jgi:hypothetical protein